VAVTVVAQAVNDLPTIKRPAGANMETTGSRGEFVPEGRLRLRQVVHGLHQGGCALPRLVANAHGAMRRDGGDEQTVTISVRW
jgi:hypothetical protein